jgi:hypothetical protein
MEIIANDTPMLGGFEVISADRTSNILRSNTPTFPAELTTGYQPQT